MTPCDVLLCGQVVGFEYLNFRQARLSQGPPRPLRAAFESAFKSW